MELTPQQVTFNTWNKVASVYEARFMHLDLYNDTYDRFCTAVQNPNAKVLEIGCGPGNITRYVLTQRPGFNLLGTDFAPNMIALAQANNPTANFKVMDCRTIATLDTAFDAIICGFCMPYLSKEEAAKLLNDCAALLSNNGILYFSVIEGDYNASGFQTGSTGDQSYVYYYQEAFLMTILKAAGFQLIELKRKQYPHTPTTFSNDMIFIVQKTGSPAAV